MNGQRTGIAILTLVVLLLGITAEQRAAFAANCSSSISGPCVIASSGIYTLTGSIQVTSSSNSGSQCGSGVGICISSGVSDVIINLNGHTIFASGSGVAAAISDGGNSAAGVAVTDGIIDGNTNSFSVAGVLATGAYARVERLQVRNAGSSSKAAIQVGNAAVVSGNTVSNSMINDATAIACGVDCLISHNATYSSGVTNTIGIATGDEGLVEGNTVAGTGIAFGLKLGTHTGYGENVFVGGTPVSGGTTMGNNVKAGTAGS
jgi:hypothetical protein